jgi:hypothetical protein
MSSPSSLPTSSGTALTRAAASISGLAACKRSLRYGSVECEDIAVENVPEGDAPCSSSGRSVDYWEMLSSAKDKCLQLTVNVYARISIWAPNVERSCTCHHFSEVTMRALATEYADKGFTAAADSITRAATQVDDFIINVADSNSKTSLFQSLIIVHCATSEVSANQPDLSSHSATRSSRPRGWVVVSWAKVQLRVDYTMACLALFVALLVGVWVYDWRVSLLFFLLKVCGDLMVSRIDCSHSQALAVLHKVCTVDKDGHLCIQMSAFERSV